MEMSGNCLDAIYRVLNTVKLEKNIIESLYGLIAENVWDRVFIECTEEPDCLKEAMDLMKIFIENVDIVNIGIYKYFWWFE